MKQTIVDGKKVIFKSKVNVPSIKTIKKVYAKIPDDKKIPVVFQTKKQYLNEYITNQEKKHNIKFTDWQKKQYKQTELKDMSNIVSRYTTKHNPYMDKRVVFFTDKKLSPKQFEKSVYHEYGHEIWEKKPGLKMRWNLMNHKHSPTKYGTMNKEEDFAESYMLHKTGALKDKSRNRIIKDYSSKNGVAEGLGIYMPENHDYSNGWKLYGMPKLFDPLVDLERPISNNIYNIVNSQKNRIALTGMPTLPVKDTVAMNQEMLGDLEVYDARGRKPEEKTVIIDQEKLDSTGPTPDEIVSETFKKKKIKVVDMPEKEQAEFKASPKEDLTDEEINKLRAEFASKGINQYGEPTENNEKVNNEKVNNEKVNKSIPLQTYNKSKYQSTIDTLAKYNPDWMKIGKYFQTKENQSKLEIQNEDKKKEQKKALEQLQLLRGSGVISSKDSAIYDRLTAMKNAQIKVDDTGMPAAGSRAQPWALRQKPSTFMQNWNRK